MTTNEFFEGQELSRQFFEVVRAAIGDIGDAELRVTKSQIAFRQRRAFAWVWMPAQYLDTANGRRHQLAPLVLTLAFHHRGHVGPLEEIVEPAPGASRITTSSIPSATSTSRSATGYEKRGSTQRRSREGRREHPIMAVQISLI